MKKALKFAMPAVALAGILAFAFSEVYLRADAVADFKACKTAGMRGEAKAAIVPCTHAIEAGTLSRPDQAMALGVRGWLYVDQHDFERALEDFNQALVLKPNASVVYVARGTVYGYMGNFAASLSDLDKGIALNPDDGEAYYARGRNYGAQGDFARAILDLDKAAELEPDYAETYKARGGMKAMQKDYNAAILDYTTALRLDPKDTATWTNRGMAYLQIGEPARAFPDLDQAIALNPQASEARSGRAFADLVTGEYEAAIGDYGEVIRLKPDAEYYVALGIAYVMQQDKVSATRALKAAIELHSSNGHLPLWLILAGGDVPEGATASSWPSPLVDYAHGVLSEEQVLAATESSDSAEQAQRECQAYFYMGALDERSGKTAAARHHLSQAAENCSKREIEAAAAKAMLVKM